MVYVSSLDFWSIMVICCLFSWPNKLVCSQRMPAGVGDWLGYWNEPGEKKVGEDSPFHLLGMGTGGMGVTIGFLQ